MDPCRNFIRKKGKWFLKNKPVESDDLIRLEKMKLPPSWKNTIASVDLNSKVQAIGMDKAGRWQYRYSIAHIEKAKREKFMRLKLFRNDLKKIRIGINKGIKENDSKAFLLRLEDKTAIRVGSMQDTKAKIQAFGLTTLRSKHVVIKGDKIVLDFIAKEGIPAHYELSDKVLASWLQKRKSLVSVEDRLFNISGSELNKYLQGFTKNRYTIKDFRTYHGTRIAYLKLKGYGGKMLSSKEKKNLIKKVSETVSNFLKNTPIMAKNSYIDPMVWEFIGGL